MLIAFLCTVKFLLLICSPNLLFRTLDVNFRERNLNELLNHPLADHPNKKIRKISIINPKIKTQSRSIFLDVSARFSKR